jgi:hypothetical protein
MDDFDDDGNMDIRRELKLDNKSKLILLTGGARPVKD